MPDLWVPPLPEPPEDEPEAPSKLDKLRAALVDTWGLDRMPEPEPLIDGVMYRNSLVWVQGKSGNGKSFVALDIAGCVGAGVNWQLHQVTQGPVLYVAAEGAYGMRWRVRAWEKAYGEDMADVKWLPQPVQAGLEAEWQALVDLAGEIQPALIIIDTQARVTVGMEENAAKDMGMFVEQLEQLREASRACVIVVHHEGRNGDHMRGSTALEGAASTVIKVTKDGEELTLSCAKQKDANPFYDILLRLVPIGDSATLMPAGDDPAGKVTAAVQRTHRKWWDTFKSDRVSATRLVKAEIATERTLYRHLRALVDAGIAQKQELGQSTYYWLDRSPEGVTATTATPKGVVADGSTDTSGSGSRLAVLADVEDAQVKGPATAKPEMAVTRNSEDRQETYCHDPLGVNCHERLLHPRSRQTGICERCRLKALESS